MVRPKQAGKSKPKTNGAAKAISDAEKPAKAPAQPVELSEKDKAKVKGWLDRQEKPFGIAMAPASLKRKRDTGMQLQSDLWEDRLTARYEVKPKDKWECLRRYKKFTGRSARCSRVAVMRC